MAEVEWYIDPDASGTADGTSWTNAYTSLNAFEAAEQTDLVTATDNYIVNCRSNSGTDDTTSVDFNGWTTSATYNILILGADFPSDGVYDNAEYVLSGAGTSDLTISESYTTVKNIQVLAASSSFGINVAATSPVDVVIDSNIVNATGLNDNNDACILISNDTDTEAEITNNVLYCSANRHGSSIRVINGTVDIYNNTCYNTRFGIYTEAGTIGIYNNASFGNQYEDVRDAGGSITSNYNATVEGFGTNAVTITQTASDYAALVTDAANGDFSVTDDSSQLYNAGINTGAPGLDIIGTSRPQATTTDIGAFELPVGGGEEEDVAGSLPAMSGAVTKKVAYHRSLEGVI